MATFVFVSLSRADLKYVFTQKYFCMKFETLKNTMYVGLKILHNYSEVRIVAMVTIGFNLSESYQPICTAGNKSLELTPPFRTLLLRCTEDLNILARP